MKTKQTNCLTFVLLISYFLFVETKLKGQLGRYESKSEIIDNQNVKKSIETARDNFIIFLENRLDYQTSIWYNELLELEDTNIQAFHPDERILCNYLFNELDKALQQTLLYDRNYLMKLNGKWFPQRTDFYDRLVAVLRSTRKDIYKQIARQLNMSAACKQFHMLNFDHLLSWGIGIDASFDVLNFNAQQYLIQYPDSIYSDFVRNYVGIEFSKNIHTDNYFELNSGTNLFNQKLAEAFTPALSFGLNFGICLRRFELQLKNCVGLGYSKTIVKLRKTEWQPENKNLLYSTALLAGFKIIDLRIIKLTPYTGVSFTSMGLPTLNLNEWQSAYTGTGLIPALNYGTSVDILFANHKKNKTNWHKKVYHYLRLSVNRQLTHFEKLNPIYTGNITSLTLGYMKFSRYPKRLK